MIVAFDLDGTLIDSMGQLRELAVRTIREVSLSLSQIVDGAYPTDDEIRRRYDSTAGETFRRQVMTILPIEEGFGPERWDDLALLYEKAKRQVTFESPVWHDVPRSLLTLADAGCRLWVVTSTATRLAVRRLDQSDMWRYFDGCLGPEFGSKSRKLEMIRADWFVGDTDRDAMHAMDVCGFMGVRRDRRLLSEFNTFAGDLRPIVATLLEEAR